MITVEFGITHGPAYNIVHNELGNNRAQDGCLWSSLTSTKKIDAPLMSDIWNAIRMREKISWSE